MTTLYLDLVGGISGDMLAGALIDTGVPLDVMRGAVQAAGLPEVTLNTQREARHQIAGTRFLVTHRDGAKADTGISAAQRAVQHVAGTAAHVHRPYRDIRTMLERSSLAAPVKDAAQRVFRVLAEAEGAVHGVDPDSVEFHEVGSWDSIADIVCAAAGLAHLGITQVYCSPVPVGSGTVRTAHGVLPVPGPATLHLLRGFPLVQGPPAFERTTPTGAAILLALAKPAPTPLIYIPVRVGIGLGSKDPPEVANLLRAVLCDSAAMPAGIAEETIEQAAANVDDANPEWIGFALEQLFAAGALDVSLLPLQMKKSRPGTQIQVLYPPHLRERVLSVLLREVPTLGVRFQAWQRWVLPRRAHRVKTRWGDIVGKV
ncbi:MAG TPA: nickel pincer cofactor biosynthesis protein LarC, partial [bacterium]